MVTLDTNVVLRMVYQDDPAQAAVILEAATAANALPVVTFDQVFAREPAVQSARL